MISLSQDPAFPAMVVDILSNVLSRADNPGQTGLYLTEELRELTGAACVALVQFRGESNPLEFRLVGLNPQRRRDQLSGPAMSRLISLVDRMEDDALWLPGVDSAVGQALRELNFGSSAAIPLRVGQLRIGLLLLLGIPTPENMAPVMDLLKTLSATVALVLRNAWLFEHQEETIAQRTDQLIRTNQALQKSEERYRTIVQTAHEGIWLIDENAQTTFVNQKMAEMVGYTPAEMLGTSLLQFMSPDSQAEAMQNLERRRQGISERQEFMFIRKDGSSLWAELNTSPILDEHNRFSGALAMVTDITERKLAGELLALNAARARLLADTSDALAAAAPRMSAVLQVAAHQFAHGPAEACLIHLLSEDSTSLKFAAGEPLWDGWQVMAVRSGAAALAAASLGTAPGSPVPLTVELHLALAEPHTPAAQALCEYQNLLALPLRAQGLVIGTVILLWRTVQPVPAAATLAFWQDLADRAGIVVLNARLFEQVQTYSSGLEQRVSERTAELEAALRELEAFSYSVSHDLRAPLRAMSGFSQILMDDFATELQPEARHFLELVHKNARKMGLLVDNLLEFSRLSRHPLDKQNVSMVDLIRQVVADLEAETPDRAVVWTLGDLPPCQGNSKLLYQVLVNLLSNALKFTRTRNPAQIEVGFGVVATGSGPAYFVRDNGVGFDMQYVEKLFNVFQRLHRTEEYEGTGVGLAIVQRIVQRHGGRVWAAAALDQGATFFFTLP